MDAYKHHPNGGQRLFIYECGCKSSEHAKLYSEVGHDVRDNLTQNAVHIRKLEIHANMHIINDSRSTRQLRTDGGSNAIYVRKEPQYLDSNFHFAHQWCVHRQKKYIATHQIARMPDKLQGLGDAKARKTR